MVGVYGEVNSFDFRGLIFFYIVVLYDSVGCLVELLEWIGNLIKVSEDV